MNGMMAKKTKANCQDEMKLIIKAKIISIGALSKALMVIW